MPQMADHAAAATRALACWLLLLVATVTADYSDYSAGSAERPPSSLRQRILPSLWPQPISHTQNAGSSRLVTGANFSCTAIGPSSDILELACGRYEGYLSAQSFPVSRRPGFDETPTGDPLSTIEITAADVTSEFGLHTNESYILTIGSTGAARLHAAHVVGALRGLETFFQLLQPLRPGEFTTLPADVVDAPRWSHRGLLVPTPRRNLYTCTVWVD